MDPVPYMDENKTDYEISLLDYFTCDVPVHNSTGFHGIFNNARKCISKDDLMNMLNHPTSMLFLERALLFLFWGSTFIAGILGNSLVVCVVVRNGPMKTVSNLYFANLAVADLLFLLFCIPYTAINHVMTSWPFGKHVCHLTHYVMATTNATCVLTLVAMGVDRYRAVVKPMASRTTRTVFRTLLLLLIIWVLAFFMSVPVIFLAKLDPRTGLCLYYFPNHFLRKAFHLILFSVYYVIPLAIIAVCYCLTLLKLYHQTRLAGKGRAAENSRARNQKVTRIMLVVVATFAVCWLPIYAYNIYSDFTNIGYEPQHFRHNDTNEQNEFPFNDTGSQSQSVSSALYIILILSQCLCYANSALNPVIYSFMSSSFRQSFRETFCCIACCSDKNKNGVTSRRLHTVSASPIPAKNVAQRPQTHQTTSKE